MRRDPKVCRCHGKTRSFLKRATRRAMRRDARRNLDSAGTRIRDYIRGWAD